MEGSMSPAKVFLIPQFVMVWKFVMMTSSFGIIIRARNPVNKRFLPLKLSLEKAKAASTVTTTITAVVNRVKTRVLAKYLAKGTSVKAWA